MSETLKELEEKKAKLEKAIKAVNLRIDSVRGAEGGAPGCEGTCYICQAGI